ncbi:3'-5' exonuclease [Helicobacter winghamensis]|uniref:3'-5' exonuclease n=1 Tax=Helicobacter winghamensis TaxID=157268 RepID=A0A2N3PIL4_9HELI|nr:3'-5' exonuclease [Helicobacter winghamensis]EEO25633.1 lipoprotein, SmpA/OmlA family [Helicobacter winghamensis ATCC BAA-430]PKT76100.1 3'-5' exonuclease [Helicobacter winghamensis]PKT76735.1 3'-5' exonuclease [Helicobacter winghamensis]PKT76856.1 3'-5' exonuclease [Helicobacter winghamensis]PKT80611.1 3'-5' exonuclease [Helicobacter winghamensis]
MVAVFDCETILDVELLKKGFKQAFMDHGINIAQCNDLELSKKAMEIQKEQSGSEFLPICYHQVVSIAAVLCDEYGKFIKVGNFKAKGDSKEEREKSIIQDFLNYLNHKQPKLVSYNGRGFDMPMLLLRAMKYRLSANAYFEENNPEFNKSKWENYRQRYCERFHLDLLEVLGNYGAVRNLKLDVLANLVGFPGKYDTSGDMVLDMYYNGELEKIDTYCQSDVLNTYGLYLNYELLKGNLSNEDYLTILQKWRDKLTKDENTKNKEYYPVFFDTISAQLNQG